MNTVTLSKAYTIAAARRKLAEARSFLEVPFDVVAGGGWETKSGDPVFLDQPSIVVNIPSSNAVVALVDGVETSIVMAKNLPPRYTKPYVAFRVSA